jgi:hypothetical protein
MAEPRYFASIRTVALGTRFVIPARCPYGYRPQPTPTSLHHDGRRQRAADGANFDLWVRGKGKGIEL